MSLQITTAFRHHPPTPPQADKWSYDHSDHSAHMAKILLMHQEWWCMNHTLPSACIKSGGVWTTHCYQLAPRVVVYEPHIATSLHQEWWCMNHTLPSAYTKSGEVWITSYRLAPRVVVYEPHIATNLQEESWGMDLKLPVLHEVLG